MGRATNWLVGWAVTIAAVAPVAMAQDVVLDSFDKPTSPAPASGQLETGVGAYAAERFATATLPGSSSALIGGGGLSVTAGPTEDPQVNLFYSDFEGAGAAKDVTAGGNTGVAFDFSSIDLGGSEMDIFVILNDGTNTATLADFIAAPVSTFFIPFTANLTPFPVTDLTSITSVTISFEPVDSGVNYVVDRVYFTTPEPASLALLAIGGMCILRRARA